MLKLILITTLLALIKPDVSLAKDSQQNALFNPPWETIEIWIDTLSDEKRLAARIKVDAHKDKICDLQASLRQKLAELRTLRYDSRSSPETLPKLGLELQEIRANLRKEYESLAQDLKVTTGSEPKIVLSRPAANQSNSLLGKK